MHTIPGLPILHSQDLVNWRIIGYAFDRLDLGPAIRLDDGQEIYGQGIWAPSFRYSKEVSIDGKPAIDVANFCREMTLSPMEAAASLSESSGEIIFKVPNCSEQPRSASIRLQGASRIESEGTEIVLTSASLQDENTIEQPRKVTPVTRSASGVSSDLTRTFAPFSDHLAAEDREDLRRGAKGAASSREQPVLSVRSLANNVPDVGHSMRRLRAKSLLQTHTQKVCQRR